MLPDWIAAETAQVPDHRWFASADELEQRLAALASAHPSTTRLRRVGSSRLGSPISCLTVGEGERDALVFGLPHPNEPIGGLTALHLATRLAEDPALRERLGLRWHVVACIDPDGLRLNEGWLRGPFTRDHYLRHFYRPAGDEQVEWTFPFDHKDGYFDRVLPETLTLMRLIDETRPSLMASLHNSEQGGAYYYLTRAQEALHPVLQALPEHHGIPLDRGEPESATAPVHAEGVFGPLSLRRIYDELERVGEPLPLPLEAGDTSDSYAARHDTLTLVVEVPYWRDARVADTTPTTTSYADALRRQADGLTEVGQLIVDTLGSVEPLLLADSPFLRASRCFGPLLVRDAGGPRRRAALPASERPATVAELAALEDSVHSMRLRFAGMLHRLLVAEVGIGNVRREVTAARDLVAGRLEEWRRLAEEDDRAEPIPIRDLVATQYGAILATARHLHAGSPE